MGGWMNGWRMNQGMNALKGGRQMAVCVGQEGGRLLGCLHGECGGTEGYSWKGLPTSLVSNGI